MRPSSSAAALCLGLLCSTLAACESESNPTAPDTTANQSINQINASAALNASNTDTLVYFSFDANALVASSATWDIALRRYEVRLNSAATAGTNNRGVTAYSFGNNAKLTNDQVLALTIDNTKAAFDSVRAAQIPADSLFKAESLIESQYAWLNLSGVPSANATAYWKVRTASGAYVLLHFTAITFTPAFDLASATIETRVQSGTALGAARTLTVTFNGAAGYVNLAQNTVATNSGCTWDLKIDPSTFAITTNSACNAGTYPGSSSPTFANQTSASDAPLYALYLTSLTAPIPNSITDLNAPFRYNLQNTNRLHPAFNTYLIKVGTKVYKLQLINYYSDAGASGYPTLRWSRIK